MLPGRHAIRFHLLPVPCETFGLFSPISHSLRSVVPLGSFFGGCPPPPVTRLCRFDFRRATLLPFGGSFPKGATRFYPGARKKSFDLFLASLSASALGVIATPNRSVVALSQNVTTLVAVPSPVSKTVTFATGRVIPKRNFLVKVLCVLFLESGSVFLFLRETLSLSRRNNKPAQAKMFYRMREFSAPRIAD